MRIKNIKVENFRLLQNSSLDMTDGLTLIVGKNNTGKTSFVVLLEKFLSKPNPSFSFSDLPVSVRSKLYDISEETDIDELSIRLCISVEYADDDNLKNISNFMLDLDPDKSTINIMFEARIDRDAFLNRMPTKKDGAVGDDKYLTEKRSFIERSVSKFIKTSIYAYDDSGYDGERPYYLENREELEEKEFKDVSNFINFQVIHARRNVASSDETGKNPLSAVTTQFFKKLNDTDDERLEQVRSALIDIDKSLETQYSDVFSGFLSSAASFLSLDGLKVISDIEASSLIGSSSKVIYGTTEDHLPENFNGLGYLNILYLLLKVEMMKQEFESSSSDINLLFIEEPEAHTHPQMQSVFSKKIREVVSEIQGLQAVITTHSSYIVTNSDFEDIRYLLKHENLNVEFRNFHTELAYRYKAEQGDEGAKLYQFLEQYLKIQNAELFFADKAIFIEGTTERILLPWFIKKHDEKCGNESQPISSQNISIIEAGANAKAFAPFLDFIGIKSLIVTDLDATKKEIKPDKSGNDRASYIACPVSDSSHTSNETLKHFFAAPDINDRAFPEWFNKLKGGELTEAATSVKVVYQTEENGYQARSFEDAFFNANKTELKRVCENSEVLGLKNKDKIEEIETAKIFELTDIVLNKKSDFAASLLYLALTGEANWITPKYIDEGLKWISK